MAGEWITQLCEAERNETASEWRKVICSSYLDKPTLVDELTDRLQVGASVGDVGLCSRETI